MDLNPLLLWTSAALTALGLLLVLWRVNHRDTAHHSDVPQVDHASKVAFLFQDGQLVDASEPAQELIGDASSYADVVARLRVRFSDLARQPPEDTEDTGTTRRISSDLPDDPGYLELDRRGALLRVSLHDPVASPSDRHQWLAAERERKRCEAVVDVAPVAIWSTDRDGTVIHANSHYHEMVAQSGTEAPFTRDTAGAPRATDTRRLALPGRDGHRTFWYDVTTRAIGPETFSHYAVSADAVVNAEVAQRNFVQTLTKTFAQLSIGLAIFDRKRQLALFNPALIDLTSLPADFLSARPSINAFFDQLRDRQIMPEPRNYKTWRDQLSDMLAAAQDGQYCETWTLPSGLTYRISGKPHPDGAVAFLFEDISAEISLTRRFRAELELSQSALDALDSAIAVFSRNGTLTFCNESFRSLWKCSPDESFIEMTIVDASRLWQSACAPSPVWGDLRDFVTRIDERSEWRDGVEHTVEGPLNVEARPLTGGSTLVRFDLKPAIPEVQPPVSDTAE